MTRMTPSEVFVEPLIAAGVSDVFGIVGSASMDALDLFPPAGIRFLSVAHEQNAAQMADGYARASGRNGISVGENGPGVTNFVTAVAITPEAGSNSSGLGGFQETDQTPIFSKITRYPAQPNRPDRIAEFTRRAFTIAMALRGPTQINIFRDHFFGEIDARSQPSQRIERGPGGAEDLAEAARVLAEPFRRDALGKPVGLPEKRRDDTVE